MTGETMNYPDETEGLDDQYDPEDDGMPEEEGLLDAAQNAGGQTVSQTTFNQERGGVAFCDLYGLMDGHVIKIDITERGENAQAAVHGLLSAIKFAKDTWHMTPYIPNQPRDPQPPAQPFQPPSQPAGAPAAPGAPASAPAAPANQPANGLQSGTLQAVRVVVEPKPGGKTRISLYGANRQYPDLYMNGTVEQLLKYFPEGWLAAHLSQAAEYNVSLNVAWKESERTTQSGKHYKDVISIEAAG